MADLSISKTEVINLTDTATKKVLIIEGVCENGAKFRPSDWVERISSTFADFGKDHRLHYASVVRPRMYDGEKVLAVEPSLQDKNPIMFHIVMKFARENKLRVREEIDAVE